MRNLLGCLFLFWLLNVSAGAEEGFSPSMPFGRQSATIQAGDIHGSGFSPTLPFGTKGMETQLGNPHQDGRPCYNNYYRGYNYYYGPGNYYNNGYGANNGTYIAPPPDQAPPGYNSPARDTAPPGY